MKSQFLGEIMHRKLLSLLAMLVLLVPFAHADEVSKRAKIEEMLTLIKIDAMMKQVINQSMAQSQQMVKGMLGDHPVSESDRKIVDDFTSKAFNLISQAFDWQKLKPAYVDLYASSYTEEEVDGILAFYKSPVGHSMLAKTPDLVTKSGAIANARMQVLQPQMKELMNDFMSKLGSAQNASPK